MSNISLIGFEVGFRKGHEKVAAIYKKAQAPTVETADPYQWASLPLMPYIPGATGRVQQPQSVVIQNPQQVRQQTESGLQGAINAALARGAAEHANPAPSPADPGSLSAEDYAYMKRLMSGQPEAGHSYLPYLGALGGAGLGGATGYGLGRLTGINPYLLGALGAGLGGVGGYQLGS